jgi:hypothetical protein
LVYRSVNSGPAPAARSGRGAHTAVNEGWRDAYPVTTVYTYSTLPRSLIGMMFMHKGGSVGVFPK